MNMGRRDFLLLGIGSAASKALGGSLPGVIDRSALTLARYEIDLGLDSPFRILHVSESGRERVEAYARKSGLALLHSGMHMAFSVCGRAGIRFVTFDNSGANVGEETVRRVEAEFMNDGPIVLVCHYPPFYTAKFQDETQRMTGAKDAPTNIWNLYDRRTRAFYAGVQANPRLRAILCGHLPVAMFDGFSETSNMYVAGPVDAGHVTELTFK